MTASKFQKRVARFVECKCWLRSTIESCFRSERVCFQSCTLCRLVSQETSCTVHCSSQIDTSHSAQTNRRERPSCVCYQKLLAVRNRHSPKLLLSSRMLCHRSSFHCCMCSSPSQQSRHRFQVDRQGSARSVQFLAQRSRRCIDKSLDQESTSCSRDTQHKPASIRIRFGSILHCTSRKERRSWKCCLEDRSNKNCHICNDLYHMNPILFELEPTQLLQ